MSQSADSLLQAFRDAVYDRYLVLNARRRSSVEAAEDRSARFAAWRAHTASGNSDTDLMRHWAVADLLAYRDAKGPDRDQLRDVIARSASYDPVYAATIGDHSPDLSRAVRQGTREGTDTGRAVLLSEHLASSPADALAAPARGGAVEGIAPGVAITANHHRLFRAIDGVIPREQLQVLAAEDARALRAIAGKAERLSAATTMAESAGAHPGYGAALAELDGDVAQEVVAADQARRQAEAEYLLVQLEKRRDVLSSSDTAVHAAAAHADAEAMQRIASEDERTLALIVVGGRAQSFPAYLAALSQFDPKLAETAASTRSQVRGGVLETQPQAAGAPATPETTHASETGETVEARSGAGEDLADLDIGSGKLDPDQERTNQDQPDEAARMQAILDRHAPRIDANVPIDALSPPEIETIAAADAGDLRYIASADGLIAVSERLGDCLENEGYLSALAKADVRAALAMKQLHQEAQYRALQAKVAADSARKRGIRGVLIDEGEAPYQFDEDEPATYFVKYREDNGREAAVWGRHLPAALRASDAQIGDLIRVARKVEDDEKGEDQEGLVCDRAHFDIEVLERSQLSDDLHDAAGHGDGSTAAAANDEQGSIPDEGAPLGAPAALEPVATTSQRIDAMRLERLGEIRRRDSEAAREAVGLSGEAEERGVQRERSSSPPPPAHAPTSDSPTSRDFVASQKPKPETPPGAERNGLSGDPADGRRPEPSAAITRLLESVTYEVQRNGNVLYMVQGKAAFADLGQQILMHETAGEESDDAILAALLLGKEKWGGKFELTGTDSFKQRAVELMIKHGVDVQLKNPEQDALRRKLERDRPASTSTAPAHIGTPATDASVGRRAAPKPTLPTSTATTTVEEVVPSVPSAAATAPEQPDKPRVMAADLAPVRATDWWDTQQAAIAYWSRTSAEREADLAKLGTRPPADQIYWFDKGGRRCDPPADAKAYADSLTAVDANVKESNMASSNGKGDDAQPVVLRGVIKDGDEYRTTALLFKGKGDYLQGFIMAGGEKRQVIVHMNKRKPDEETGEVRPNFLKVAELTGDRANPRWKEIGYGNAVNHRSDGKVVHFDEVLFNIGKDVVKARVTGAVAPELHRSLGFSEARKPRDSTSSHVATETSDPKAKAPAAHAQEVAAGGAPTTKSRRSSRTRAAA